MKLRVYIDPSVVGGYFDDESRELAQTYLIEKVLGKSSLNDAYQI